MEVWTKNIGLDAKGMAFAFLNLDDAGGPIDVCTALLYCVFPIVTSSGVN